MEGRYQIDRAKHDLDILEHVMGGIHTWPDIDDHVVDVRVSVRPWVDGRVISSVQVQVVGSSLED